MLQNCTAFLLVAAAVAQAQGSLGPDKILEAAGVRTGSVVCEIGAGDGSLSISAARRVGPGGRVYASELGEGRVRKLQEKVAASGTANITVLAGAADRTNLPNGACDAIVLHDVYHHLTEPGAMNRSIAAALKAGGRLAVVDFMPPPGQEAIRPADRAKDGMHGVMPDTVHQELKEAGLEPVLSEAGSRWFLIVFTAKSAT